MSQLQKLTTSDIWCPGEGSVAPGKWVKHVADDDSWGMVVARAGDANTEVLVLWSRQPNIRPAPLPSNPPAMPKQMRVWMHDSDEVNRVGQMYDHGLVSAKFVREFFEIEETYDGIEMSNEQLDMLKNDGADITFHSNGDIVVKRESHDLPSDIDPAAVRRGFKRRF